MRIRLRSAALERLLLSGLLVACAAQAASAFGLEDVAKRAKQLAASAYADPRGNVPRWLLDLNYDQWRDIRFRPDRALWSDRKLPFQVQFFHPGLFYDRTVILHVVDGFRSRVSRHLLARPASTTAGTTSTGRVPQDLGYAGFRIHYPIKSTSYHDEVIGFLGASYFRAVGRDQVYGLSARGLAIDTALSSGRGVPLVSRVLAGAPARRCAGAHALRAARQPSVTGAYRFVVAPGDADARGRRDAPVFRGRRSASSASRRSPACSPRRERNAGDVVDFRPEVHDSDGLLVDGEQRRVAVAAARQPARPRASASFELADPRGLRPGPARPRLRPLPGPRDPAGAAPERLGRAHRATGARAASSWSRSRPTTTSTTTSSPTGCPRCAPDAGHARLAMPIRCSGTATIATGRRVDESLATRRDGGTHPGARRLVVDFEGKALRRCRPTPSWKAASR